MGIRDQFAAQALRGILGHIENPESISNNEMNLYCSAAYQWAANMMVAAAAARATNKYDSSGSGTSDDPTRSSDPANLESNTELLLNDLYRALSRTDESYQFDTGKEDPKTHQPIYETRYAERILFKDVNMEGIEALIKQQRGYYIEGEGSSATEKFYDESYFEHYLRELLNNFIKHTPISQEDTKTTVGFEDLITAVVGNKPTNYTTLLNNLASLSQLSGIKTTLDNINTNLAGIKDALEARNNPATT